MKTRNFSILFVVLVTVCLTAGTALANETTIFELLSHRSALAAPTLTVATAGTTVTASWTSVTGATGYTLYYAPFPYTGPDSIGNIPMGTQTSISASLSDGAAFYVAVQAYDSVESSGYSNIEYFAIYASSYTNGLGQTFRLIPAGTFTMGSPSNERGRDSDETQHQVTLSQSFYMMTTEVTQAQWQTVMGSNPSSFTGCSTCPVEMVSWNDVHSYITQMNLRGEGIYGLPTEAQWEYAARAGSTTAFYNGGITSYSDMYDCNYDANLNAIGWYCYNINVYSKTKQVAGKAPNAWGLYDMPGNVAEWCQDWYSSRYYDSGAVTNPTGPSSGSSRVLRGGFW
jgi:formylglycine-generating enzyme required for sulfatase activity